MAKIYVNTSLTTSSSITVQLIECDTTYEYDDRVITWRVNGVEYGKQYNVDAGIYESDEYVIDGLSPGTTYKISARVKYWDATAPGSGYQLETISTRKGQLDNVVFSEVYESFDASTGDLDDPIDVSWTTDYGLWDLYGPEDGYVEYEEYIYLIDYQVMDGDDGVYAHYKSVHEIVPMMGADAYTPWMYATATTNDDRPAYFYWTYSKTSGGEFNLTATEWNRLTTNINAVRKYKGLSAYGFETASSGGIFKADMYNDAVWALDAIDSGIWSRYLDTYESGDIIYAYYLNDLKDALNDIE